MTPTTLVDLWERQAAASPDALALLAHGERLTYAELDARATLLAARLRARGAGTESLVGVCLPRSAELLVALLGVLKAGGAYVPLDPGYPAERLAHMAGDCGLRLVLCGARHTTCAPFEGEGLEFMAAEGAAEPHGARATAPVDPGVEPRNLAYVIYTSGSTGRPKGVAVTHASIVSFLHSMAREPGLRAGDRVLGLTPLSFDISTLEMFLPLTVGATVVLAPADANTDPAALAATVEEHGVTFVQATPTTWRMLTEWGWRGHPGLTLVSGGEPLDGQLARRLLKRGRALWNLYGPTETTVWSTASRITEPEPVTVGTAIDNTGLHVVDGHGRRLGPGGIGELWISGAGLARGYAGRPGLTAERFVADPFGAPGSRAYRTGDLARFLPDGRLDILGRADQQIKLRGFRIELGEVEEALRARPEVADCVVLLDEHAPGGAHLVACVVPRAAQPADWETQLRAHLGRSLPAHMVPRHYATLPALPRTPAGKTDRAAVAARLADARRRAGAERGTGDAPAADPLLARVRELLAMPRLGAGDDLIDAGTTSLDAVRVAVLVARWADARITVADVYRLRTVDRLRARGAEAPPTAPLMPQDTGGSRGPAPMTHAQRRFWLAEQTSPGDADNMLVLAYRLTGPVDSDALELALRDVVERHAALRTVFPWDGDDLPVPRVLAPDAAVPEWERTKPDGGAAPADAREAARLATLDWWERPFSLDDELPLRARWCDLDDDHHLLCLHLHHIAFDGWSEALLIDDLGTAYTARRTGSAPSFTPAPCYADYAHWEHRNVDRWTRDDLPFWRQALRHTAPAVLPAPTSAGQATRRERVVSVAPHTVERLTRAAGRHGGPPAAALLAATGRGLARAFDAPDVCLGTATAGRFDPALASVTGYFVNPLVVPLDGSRDLPADELLTRAADALVSALEHARTPFDELVRVLPATRGRHPWFQVWSVLQQPLPYGEFSPGVTVEAVRVPPPSTELELMFEAIPRRDGSWELVMLWREDGIGGVTAGTLLDSVETALCELAELA
ncbi:amino acid adenylation domain-containing protein [Streptomyces sp. NPDC050560]|uniref:amino acid adenylation domain-containing protein n=1 Tax=Streptomyces sp. NPDC050560 TaxID=3365630 RepID=UPI0037B3BB7D